MRRVARLSTFTLVSLTFTVLLLTSSASAVVPPYSEGFESEPTCGTSCSTVCTLSTTGWTNVTGTDDRDWLVDVGGTSSTNTGPSVDHTLGTAAGKYLYIETSSPCHNVMGVSSLISPPIDLSTTAAPVASFWYHMYGVDQGAIHVDVLDATLAVLATDVIPAMTGDHGDQWFQTQGINLAPFVPNGTVHVRIRHVHSGVNYYGDSAIDDFEIYDNSVVAVELTALGGEAPPVLGAIPPGPLPVLVGGLQIGAYGPSAHQLTSATVTNAGTAADAALRWQLYLDDGDNVPSAADQLLGDVAQANGEAVFTGAPLLTVQPLTSAKLWLTATVQPGAAAGETFAASIADPTSDLVFDTSPLITVSNPPIQGYTYPIGELAALPYGDDFSQPVLLSRRDITGPGLYPASSVSTIPPTVSAYSGSALIEWMSSSGSLYPVDGSGLCSFSYPNGNAVSAIQYSFDLSGLSVQTDLLWLFVRYANTGQDPQDEDGIFISGDGGVTWDMMTHKFSWTTTGAWVEVYSDLSALLSNAGLDYTDSFVIRVQARDELASDVMLLDAVIVGTPPAMTIERESNVIPDEGTDDLGGIPTAPTSLTYEIHNVGGFPLQLGLTVLQNVSSFESLHLSLPATSVVEPGDSAPLVIDLEPFEGPFHFDLVVTAEDPALGDDTYTITVTGEGIPPAPEIDVQRPAGESLASGSVDDQSSVTVGQARSLSYSIINSGDADLSVGLSSIEAATNVEASITATPTAIVPPGDSTTLELEYTVSDVGAFSFDLVIENSDADEAPYTITVSGQGTEGGTGGGGTGGGPVDGHPDEEPDDEGGCGCELPGGQRGGSGLALALLGLGLLLRRRTRR